MAFVSPGIKMLGAKLCRVQSLCKEVFRAHSLGRCYLNSDGGFYKRLRVCDTFHLLNIHDDYLLIF